MLGKADYIGLDIGNYAIKIARVKKSGRTFTSSSLAYEILPEHLRGGKYNKEMQDLVTDLLKLHSIKKGTPVLHVGAGDAIMRNVTVPEDTSKEGLEGAIELDLGSSLPFSLEQVYYDFDTEADENGAHLAVAAQRDLVNGKVKLLDRRVKSLGVPEVDVDIFAYERLVEALHRAGEMSESTVAILDIGYTRSRVLVYRDQRYAFTREPQIGGYQVDEMIRDVYDIDMEEAQTRKINQNLGDEYGELVLQPYVTSLAEQLNLAMDFYEASSPDAKPVEKIYITGGGGLLKGLVPALSAKVSIPLEKLDLSQHIRLAKGQGGILQDGLSHALAIALAMEGK